MRYRVSWWRSRVPAGMATNGMKYVIFFSALLLVVPIGALLASQFRRVREGAFVLMVISTLFVGSWDINFWIRPSYRAMVRSIQFSLVDFLLWIVLLGTVMSVLREGRRLYWPASLGPMLVLLGWSCVSVAIFEPRLYGLFLLSNMVRGLLVFLAVAWFVRSEREVWILVWSLVAIFGYLGCLCLWQRYIEGAWRVTGTFGHANTLADYCVLFGPVLLGCSFLEGRAVARSFCAAAWALSGIAIVLSVSRGGVLYFAVSYGVVALVAMRRHPSLKRMAIVFVLGLLGGGLLLLGWDKIEGRNVKMNSAVEADRSAGRSVYYEVAWEIVRDHPLGVGLNNYASYFPTLKESTDEDLGADLPHVLYMQFLAELGWPGLLILVFLFLRLIFLAGRNLAFLEPGVFFFAGAGCLAAFVSVSVSSAIGQSLFGQTLYIPFNILIGLAAATHFQRATVYVSGGDRNGTVRQRKDATAI